MVHNLLKTVKMTTFIQSTIKIISAIIFQIKTMNVKISQEKVNEHAFPRAKISNKML